MRSFALPDRCDEGGQLDDGVWLLLSDGGRISTSISSYPPWMLSLGGRLRNVCHMTALVRLFNVSPRTTAFVKPNIPRLLQLLVTAPWLPQQLHLEVQSRGPQSCGYPRIEVRTTFSHSSTWLGTMPVSRRASQCFVGGARIHLKVPLPLICLAPNHGDERCSLKTDPQSRFTCSPGLKRRSCQHACESKRQKFMWPTTGQQ